MDTHFTGIVFVLYVLYIHTDMYVCTSTYVGGVTREFITAQEITLKKKKKVVVGGSCAIG